MKMVSEKESRVKKLLKSPLRFMVKARDFYVNGMTQFSDQLARYDTVSTVPMSFAFSRGNASCSDYRELVMGNLESRVLAQDLLQRRVGGLGRIEEDKPCDYFGGDDSVSEFGNGGFRRSRRFAGFAGRTPAAGKKRKAAAAAAGVC